MLYVNPLLALYPASRAEAVLNNAASEQVALEELEHLFLFTLLQEMRKSIPHDGLFEGRTARETYEEMMDDALSGAMAKTGQLGIARMIEEQLRIAETQQSAMAQSRSGADGLVK